MNLPDGRRGRLVAIGLLLIIAILAGEYGLRPLWQRYTQLADDTEDASAQLARLQRLAADLPALRAHAERLEQARPLAPYLLQAANPALAAAELQRRLQDLVKTHGGRMLSSRVQQPEDDGPLQNVSINARINIALEGLQALLYELETTPPFTYVDSLNITTRARPAGRRTPEIDELDVRLDLHGLRESVNDGGSNG